MSHEQDAGATPNRPGPPWEKLGFDLLILVVLILIALAGRVKQAVQPKPVVAPTIQLGEPRLSSLSESDAAEAAQLLGSSLAELWTAGGEPTP